MVVYWGKLSQTVSIKHFYESVSQLSYHQLENTSIKDLQYIIFTSSSQLSSNDQLLGYFSRIIHTL
jgi:hypothetical protein